MRTVAVVQARMGSSRLPGKVMLPLAGDHVLTRVVERVQAASRVDAVVVATSTRQGDDIVVRYAERAGAGTYRGSEEDVLGRMYGAATAADAEAVVRVTADCPLVSPAVIDELVSRLHENGTDYVSSELQRTFPRGVGAEAFTADTFATVERRAEAPYEREHVTPCYYETPTEFDVANVTADEVFEHPRHHDRTDLRLTLDEADDYELFRELYVRVEPTGLLTVPTAIDVVDDAGLTRLNDHVEQKTLDDETSD